VRILSIGNFGTGWDGSICDEEHIAKALEGLGHEVVRHQRELPVSEVPVNEYDFVLIQQWDGYEPDLTEKLNVHLDHPVTVYAAFDYQEWNQEWHKRLMLGSSLYLSKRLADSGLPGVNWQYWPQDFAPEFLDEDHAFKQRLEFNAADKDIDVLFTGSYLPWATERIETLRAVDKEFDLHIYSVTPDQWKAEGFKNVHGPVMDEALPALIARAKINLSIDHTIEAGYWSDRNAQTMACGGFVLFRHVPMSEVVFGDNIAYFYNTEDCLKKVRQYLADDFKREHIASLGQQYARRNLMVENRVKQLLTIVEGIL
jgi:hypothetical protein